MDKKRFPVSTILLLVVIGVMIILIVFIGRLLIANNGSSATNLAPKKIKAAGVTYQTVITLNQNLLVLSPTLPPPLPTTAPTTPMPTYIPSPTPTEIILAIFSPTAVASPSAIPSGTRILPSTGFVTGTIFFIILATLIIFFSLLF